MNKNDLLVQGFLNIISSSSSGIIMTNLFGIGHRVKRHPVKGVKRLLEDKPTISTMIHSEYRKEYIQAETEESKNLNMAQCLLDLGSARDYLGHYQKIDQKPILRVTQTSKGQMVFEIGCPDAPFSIISIYYRQRSAQEVWATMFYVLQKLFRIKHYDGQDLLIAAKLI